LCHDIVRPESRAVYSGVVDRLAAAGAEVVILGCTEIGLLIGDEDVALPTIDTTRVHAAAGVDFLLDR